MGLGLGSGGAYQRSCECTFDTYATLGSDFGGAFWIPLQTQAEETASKQDSEGLTEDFL